METWAPTMIFRMCPLFVLILGKRWRPPPDTARSWKPALGRVERETPETRRDRVPVLDHETLRQRGDVRETSIQRVMFCSWLGPSRSDGHVS
jgi:hypothetical protein